MTERGGIGGVLTSVVLIVACTVVAAYGTAVASATLDIRRLYDEFPEDTTAAAKADSLYATILARTERWVGIPGTQAPALDIRIDAASLVLDAASLERQRDSLVAHLAVEPTASLSWARLARVRALTERPMEEVEQALRMSVLTGRYEMSSMVQRLVLAMPLWRDLSEDMRRTVRTEIRSMSPSLSWGDNFRIKTVAQTLPAPIRDEVYGLFRDAGRQF